MTPYIVCALLSCFCVRIGTRIKPNKLGKENTVAIFLYFVAALLPSLLAGYRDNTVGTDVMVYGEHMFIAASHSKNIVSFFTNAYTTVEPLFRVLVYVAGRSGNRVFYYFLLEFACVLPVLYFLIKKYRASAHIGMAFYYFWLFGFTLNIMRQSIAMSILLCGTELIKKRNIKKYIVAVLFAAGFHRTAVIGFIPYVMYPLLFKMNSEYGKEKTKTPKQLLNFSPTVYGLVRVAFIGLIFVAIINIQHIISIVVNLTGIYSQYLDMNNSNASSGPAFLVLTSCILAILWYISKQQSLNRLTELRFYLYVVICGVLLFYSSAWVDSMFRISLYFTMYIIPYSAAIYLNKRKGKIYYLSIALITMIAVLFILNFYVLKRWNGIYPYTSKLLGI